MLQNFYEETSNLLNSNILSGSNIASSGSNSGIDDSTQAKTIPVVNNNNESFHLLTGADSGSDTVSGRTYSGSVSDTDTTGNISGQPFPLFDPLSPYFFQGSISNEVMQLYLDRSLAMYALSHSAYNADNEIGSQTTKEHQQDLNMIQNLKPKFITGLAGFSQWIGFTHDQLSIFTGPSVLDILASDIQWIHSNVDQEIICGGGVGEYADSTISYMPFPQSSTDDPDFYEVCSAEIGRRLLLPITAMPNQPYSNLPFGPYGFDWQLMLYPSQPSGMDPENWHKMNGPNLVGGMIDITQDESQMFLYWAARKFIDSGCETFHCGDMFQNVLNDPGNVYLWQYLSRVRAYAAKHARRNLVLLEGRLESPNYFYNPDAVSTLGPRVASPGPPWTWPLVFDFLSRTLYFNPSDFTPCTDVFQPYTLEPAVLKSNLLGLGNGPGGLNPQGWYCKYTPILLDFDNAACIPTKPISLAKCILNSFDQGGVYNSYNYNNDGTNGWDEITWFQNQGVKTGISPGDPNNTIEEDNPNYRNAILKYVWYRIKCLDPNAHFLLPGKQYGCYAYRAEDYDISDTNNSFGSDVNPTLGAKVYYNDGGPTILSIAVDGPAPQYGQQSTIAGLWQGTFFGHSGWVFHNFTKEQAINENENLASNLIIAGTDKKYYIATDGYIYGCVLDNGAWITICPSYQANYLHGQWPQQPAFNSLVATPDGSSMVYIGTDGYIYGFTINSVYDYSYFSFRDMMRTAGITAASSLIYPDNHHMYFISTQIFPHGNVWGICYFSGAWQLVSLSSPLLSYRILATGPLAYAYGTGLDRIYYPSTDGLLAYFTVDPTLNYAEFGNYHFEGNNLLTDTEMSILGNLAIYDDGANTNIYFVGYRPSDAVPWVYWIGGNDTAGWNITSLSANSPDAGNLVNEVAGRWDGLIAVSPDGSTVAYFGVDEKVHFFNTTGWPYLYFNTSVYDPDYSGKSLQFAGNGDVYYGCPDDGCIHHLVYEEVYCNNPAIDEYLALH